MFRSMFLVVLGFSLFVGQFAQAGIVEPGKIYPAVPHRNYSAEEWAVWKAQADALRESEAEPMASTVVAAAVGGAGTEPDAAPVVSDAKQRFHDLILLLDPEGDETEWSDKIQALTSQLMIALYEQAAPIITTTNILQNFCSMKTDQTLVGLAPQISAAMEMSSSPAVSRTVFDQVVGPIQSTVRAQSLPLLKRFHDRFDLLMVLESITLTDSEWVCFLHEKAKLVLLVPRTYIQAQMDASVVDVSAQMQRCGFNVESLYQITELSPKKYLKTVEDLKISVDLIPALRSMFVARSSDMASWHIYLVGHGQSPVPAWNVRSQIETARRLKQADEQQLQELLQRSVHLGDFANQDEPHLRMLQRVVASSDDYRQRDISVLKRRILKKRKEIRTKSGYVSGFQDMVVVPESGRIAGISYGDFDDLMQFFSGGEAGINVSFLYYLTCYGGGRNQTSVNDMLAKIKANFMVVASGSNESVTLAAHVRWEYNPAKKVCAPKADISFGDFFTALRDFFGTAGRANRDPIKNIVKHIVGHQSDNNNQPFVRVPGVGIFQAFTVDKFVKILTNSLVKVHELEGRPIDCNDSAITHLLVYPEYIGVPLEMNSAPSKVITLPSAQTADQSAKQRVCIFEKIVNKSDRFCSIFFNMLRSNASYAQPQFFIRKLICRNYVKSGIVAEDSAVVILSDVLMKVQTTNSAFFGVESKANIRFTHDAKVYHAMVPLEKSDGIMVNPFEKVTFAHVLVPEDYKSIFRWQGENPLFSVLDFDLKKITKLAKRYKKSMGSLAHLSNPQAKIESMLTRIEAATTDEYFAELKASSKYDHGRFVAMLEQMRNTLAQLDERTSDDALKARIVAGQAKISAEIGSVPAAAAPTAGWAKNAEGKWRLSEAE